MQTCSITKDQGRLLGATQMKRKVSLLNQWKTYGEVSKFMIAMARSATAGSF